MVHLFHHYVPVRVLLLAILEALILLFAAFAGLSLHYIGTSQAAVGSSFMPEALTFASGMMLVMLSMGLYEWDAWKDNRKDNNFMNARLAGAFLVGFLAVALAAHLAPSLNIGFGAIGATVGIALTGTWVARTAFFSWSNVSSFKSRVLVLGTGSRVSRLAEHQQHNSNSRIIGYLALKPSTHYVPASRIMTLTP